MKGLLCVLAKGASQLGSRSKASLCFCDVSYTLLSLGCLVHVVMLLRYYLFTYRRKRSTINIAEKDQRRKRSKKICSADFLHLLAFDRSI